MKIFHIDQPREIGKKGVRVSSRDLEMVKNDLEERALRKNGIRFHQPNFDYEYREVTPYWSKRLEGRHYDVIQFRNGYAKVAPMMIVEFKGVDIDTDVQGLRYAIELGEILETKNVI